MQQQGNTTGYTKGDLIRRLPQITIATFAPSSGDAEGIVTFRVKVQGLSRLLAIDIGIGIAPEEGQDQVLYPVNPGTVQITPVMRREGNPALALKPALLVPALVPVLFTISEGYLAGGDQGVPLTGDEAWLDIVLDPLEYVDSGIIGRMLVEVTGTYVGGIMDPKIIEHVLGQLRVNDSTSLRFQTGE